ncbi:ABC transporter substrate-binding protein [Nitriliruptoraceae bacterium ZYF776]|nr:ABC transporter substrate-binding protein [Profundirhabdus halotolerans]
MRIPSRPRTGRATGRHLAAVVAVALAAAACGGEGPTADGGDDAEGEAAVAEGGVDYPLTIENCGTEITFEAPPERVFLLHSAPVSSLQALGLLDRVVGRAGAFPEEYLDDEAQAAIDAVPSLTEEVDGDGHFEVSAEAIVEAEPDLVMGLTEGVTREGLADLGIPVLEVPSQCPGETASPGYDDVLDLTTLYGDIFDRTAAAEDYNAQLQARLDAVAEQVGDEDRTAAVLYPTVGGGTGWAYGTVSMAHPQLEAAGFDNVFGDVQERVFEVSLEDLIDRDPDVLVLLHVDGEPGPVEDAIRSLPGADGMTAVQDDAILVQLFNFSEPPTPLTVDGLERIVDAFGDAR